LLQVTSPLGAEDNGSHDTKVKKSFMEMNRIERDAKKPEIVQSCGRSKN
jgi:hypothetical protein